jgi:site-specific DNA-methyltransferase (adenine-specific)
MFLGGFSTARVAIGLNRRVTGFEISEPVFAAKTAEIRATKPGYLLPGLRTPEKTGDPPNRGKPWTDAETSRLAVRFAELRDAGMTKKDTVAVLGQELGRGRWAIERMLKGLDTGG